MSMREIFFFAPDHACNLHVDYVTGTLKVTSCTTFVFYFCALVVMDFDCAKRWMVVDVFERQASGTANESLIVLF